MSADMKKGAALSVLLDGRKALRGPLAAAAAATALVTMTCAAAGAFATPQALAAALSRDPSFMPATPAFTKYHRGRVTPVSASDAKAGVIAEFVVAFDYLVKDPTSGLTYRVFRDQPSAQAYFDGMSVLKQPGFITPQGNSIASVVQSTDPVPDSKAQGFKTIKCETFLDPRIGYEVTARCAVLCDSAPVIVSGVRIQPGHVTRTNKIATHEMEMSDMNAAKAIAIGLVWGGVQRIVAENALLESGLQNAH
jgi:hypothetical protein